MSTRRLTVLAVAAGCVLTTLGISSPTQAASEHTIETGVVDYIVDGDTINVDLTGGPIEPVRLLGVQAMEAYHPSSPGSFDQCHAAAAREELRSLVDGKTVQLRAISASSTSKGRLHRSVWVQQGGVWVDVQKILIQKSLGLPIPSSTEPTHNIEYLTLAQQVAKAGQGIWDPTSCGSGPGQSVSLKLIVHWDADSNDATNINDEWVSIQNTDATESVNLSKWWVRDSSLSEYVLPTGTVLDPGERVIVRVGKGSNTTVNKYWGLTEPTFDNGGDGAYLFDPDGDLREWMMYPCLTSCTDPAMGDLSISKIAYDPTGSDSDNVNGEYVKIKNVSDRDILMRPYIVRSWPYTYTFSPKAWIDAGETLTLKVGKGSNSVTTRYWGKSDPIFNNSGDVAEIVTYDDIQLACKSYGNKSC